MEVGVYFPQNNQLHVDVLEAFAKGIEASGDIAHRVVMDNSCVVDPRFDYAVVFGVYKIGVEFSRHRGAVIKAYKDAGKRVLILERGYIKRDAYFSAGWDGFNGNADFRNLFSKSDRWNELGVELKPKKYGDGDYILICGQVPWDASVQHTNHIEWISQTIYEIKRIAVSCPVVYRPHPLAGLGSHYILGAKTSTKSLEEDLAGAKAVVTFNSNTGVDAVVEGIQTFSFDRGSMVWDVSHHDLENLNALSYMSYAREQWAYNIAYAQWTLKEMERGLPWQHLTRETQSNANKNVHRI